MDYRIILSLCSLIKVDWHISEWLNLAYRVLTGSEIKADAPRPHIKKSVDALRCSEKQDRVFLWDDALSGFGVAAFPSQKKIYYAQYRQHGRSRRIALGEHGRLTLTRPAQKQRSCSVLSRPEVTRSRNAANSVPEEPSPRPRRTSWSITCAVSASRGQPLNINVS